MKRMFFASMYLVLYTLSSCQTPMNPQATKPVFPRLQAKTLAGNKPAFPYSIKGKKSFFVLAFEDRGEYQNCQYQANVWAAFWEQSLQPQGVVFYEIPMMSGKYGWISWWVDSGMRSGIDKAKHDQVACFYGDKAQYMEILSIHDLSQAHVFLLDAAGVIAGRASGLPEGGNSDKISHSLQQVSGQ